MNLPKIKKPLVTLHFLARVAGPIAFKWLVEGSRRSRVFEIEKVFLNLEREWFLGFLDSHYLT